jgi:hypothetical protein
MRPQGPGQNDPRLGTKRPKVRDKTTQGPGQNDPGAGTKRPRVRDKTTQGLGQNDPGAGKHDLEMVFGCRREATLGTPETPDPFSTYKWCWWC